MDHNSNTNQEIKGKFVAREVLACFSYEMEAVLRASGQGNQDKDYPLPTYEEIENLYNYICPECGAGQPSLENFNDADASKPFTCPECKKQLDAEPESEPQEIFEWWIVSKWLAQKLSAKGEPVLEWGNNWYWGRTCSGQAILLDGVISEICEEMEILEGQRKDWGKK